MNIYPCNGWVYYKSGAMMEEEELRRISPDFSSSEEFIEGKCLDFGIAGDWIFYRDERIFEQDVYMMKLDKSEKKKLYSVEIDP
jgi:hypothetical protein